MKNKLANPIDKMKWWLVGGVMLLCMGFVSTFYGNLSVPVGGSIVDGNAPSGSCMQATTGGRFAYTGLPCGTGGSSYTFSSPLDNASGTISLDNTIPGNRTFTGNSMTLQPASGNTDFNITDTDASGHAYLNITTTNQNIPASIVFSAPSAGCTKPCLSYLGVIDFRDPGPGLGLMARIYTGQVVASSGLQGSNLQLVTTVMGGGLVEAVQGVPNGHAGFPQDQTRMLVTTPGGGCTASVTCGQFTWTFSHSFVDLHGLTSIPYCDPPSIQETGTDHIWTGNVNTVSDTAVVYNYASLQTVPATSVTAVLTCHEGPF